MRAQKLTASVLMIAVITGPGWSTPTDAIAASPPAEPAAGTVVEATSISPYGAVLAWHGKGQYAGSPLYEFSGDGDGKFGCSSQPLAMGIDPADEGAGVAASPASCTGPMSDFVEQAIDDDWPALTTTAPPVAGPGVDKALLGTVQRPGIGDQVTYGGHPLYLFDLPSDPAGCTPCGEDIPETVAPLYPWHGIWYLVSAKDGRPDPGRAHIEDESLPDGKLVLAAGEAPTTVSAPVTVYALNGDRGPGACIGACALTWIPVRTAGAPQTTAVPGDAVKEVGVVRRVDGTYQVTYEGKPLYLYSAEKFTTALGQAPQFDGTSGNGNGLPAPSGGTFTVVPVG
jgi:predicted lipoprotein with Yx(FWY)xxD motif